MSHLPVCADLLWNVLEAAKLAPGNRPRFLAAGLINEKNELVADWQAAFNCLKPLTKAELRSQPGQFLAQASDVVFRGKTSGTQGEAFTYFAGECWNQKRIEARQLGLNRWGIEPTTPVLNLASRLFPVQLQDNSLVGEIDDTFLQTLLAMIAAQPLLLRGYPSRLWEVAIALHYTQSCSKLAPVVAVITTGECLFEFQRTLLSQTFQAPIVNEYGCQESGISGFSCPEGGRIHLDNDRCLYEIIQGELLTTDLYNQVMPMVRYSSGDQLHLFSDTCACGRPGLTARVLGRQEDAIFCKGEPHWPGEFELPPFPDILGYQIQIHPDRHRLWVQPTLETLQPNLAPLKDWTAATLGGQEPVVVIESPWTSPILSVKSNDSLPPMDSETWWHQVMTQPWLKWLTTPLPWGEARETAALLRQLVAPGQIVLRGLPRQTLRLIHTVAQSEPAHAQNIEAIKIRVLLWATGLMAGDAARAGVGSLEFESLESENPDLEAFYLTLLARFQQWADGQAPGEHAQASALGFDLLAPLLSLDTPITQRLWPSVQALIRAYWPQGLKADRFTLHHYLAILDHAGQQTQPRPHPWQLTLRPLAAILQGDLSCFVSTLDLEIVAIWAEIIHNSPGTFMTEEFTAREFTADTRTQRSWAKGSIPMDFRGIWQAERRALLQQDQAAVNHWLSQLFDKAQSPVQVAQCWLETGYSSLVFSESLDPLTWVKILQQQVGLLGNSTHSKSSKSVSNPLPWMPILRALAPKLIKIGQPTWAYACLFAAAPPNRHMSNFDRQTKGFNGKQRVLGNWQVKL